MDDGAADNRAFGELAHGRELVRSRDSEANRNRKRGEPPDAFHESASVSGHLRAGAGDASARDGVNKAGRNLGDQLQPLVGRGGRREKNGCKVMLARLAQILGRFFNRQIGDQRSVNPRQPRDLAELSEAHAQDGIEVGEDDQSDGLRMLANFRGESEYVLERCSVFKSSLAGALDDRAIGERIAERDSEFDHARACVDGCEDDFARGGKVGIAAGYVGDELGLGLEMKRHEGIVDGGEFPWSSSGEFAM